MSSSSASSWVPRPPPSCLDLFNDSRGRAVANMCLQSAGSAIVCSLRNLPGHPHVLPQSHQALSASSASTFCSTDSPATWSVCRLVRHAKITLKFNFEAGRHLCQCVICLYSQIRLSCLLPNRSRSRDILWVLVIFASMPSSRSQQRGTDDRHAFLKITPDSSFELSPKWQ